MKTIKLKVDCTEEWSVFELIGWWTPEVGEWFQSQGEPDRAFCFGSTNSPIPGGSRNILKLATVEEKKCTIYV